MEMIPPKPERKAQLEEYAQRHGQDPVVALDEVWRLTWNGSARISRKPLKVSAGGMKT
jgi:hypothetical protein